MSCKPDVNKQGVEMLFSQQIYKITHPPLFIKVDEHKHLGIISDPKLTSSKEFLEVRERAWLGFLGRAGDGGDRRRVQRGVGWRWWEGEV